MAHRIVRSLPVLLLALSTVLLGWYPVSVQAAPSIRIEAEDYARYEDTDARNVGDSSVYTAPGPDVFACASSCANGHMVGAFYGGEWLEFDLAIPQRQTYTVLLRYGTRNATSDAQLLVDGQPATERVRLASTGHYERLASQDLGTVTLAAGTRRLRLIAHGPYSVDYLELQPVSTVPPPRPAATRPATTAATASGSPARSSAGT